MSFFRNKEPLSRWRRRPARWALWLEWAALALERPVNQLIGNARLNPFYHTGPIALFLLLVVGGTGFYLFLFFHYGFDASYEAVAQYDTQFIARTMRAVHRYASGALVITTLLHALRTLFMERFRGQRWLAWVTGMVLTFLIWLAGVSGYWLVWDSRAQLINNGFVRFLERWTPWAADYVVWLAEAELGGKSWPVLLLLLAVHVLLFLVAAGFFWLHIRRLQRPKWLPDLHWMVGISIVLLLAAVLFPLAMLPPADPAQLPAAVSLDPIFLFYLPAVGRAGSWALWSVLGVVTAVALALPWITHDRIKQMPEVPLPKVNILQDRCTGCTKCALDCPFGAIVMVERHDDKPHKFIALEDAALCVSCGICVGSCDEVAVTMGEVRPEWLWDEVALNLTLAQAGTPGRPVKLVFTCERHAAHGARPYLGPTGTDTAVATVPLPCVGALPPDLLPRALVAGAAEVQIIGCPPDDCRSREGNLWAAQRLQRQRVPRLKRAFAQAPITAVWLPPNEFEKALATPPVTTVTGEGQTVPDYMASRRLWPPLTWRNYTVAFGLLLLVLLLQVFLTEVRVSTAGSAQVQVVLPDLAGPLNPDVFAGAAGFGQLILAIDGRVEVFAVEPNSFYITRPLPAGETDLQLYYAGNEPHGRVLLFADRVNLVAGQVLRLPPAESGRLPCTGLVCVK